MFYRRVNNFVGIESVGYRHIEALYDLGYLPIRIKALPEGSVCPIRVPMMTITNTLPEFFWLTNYLETIITPPYPHRIAINFKQSVFLNTSPKHLHIF